MGNKPWEEKVTEDNSEKLTRQSASNDMVSTPILTILLSLFFLIIIGILFFVLYASNGGGNEKKASSTFYMEAQKQRKQKLAIRKHRLFLILPKQQRMQRLHLAVILLKYSLVKVLRRLLPEQESQLRNCMN